MAKLKRESESGQAVTEYILIMAVVTGFFVALVQGIVKMKLAQRLTAPITTTFAAAYQYGHPKAKGFDDDGPKNHPRANGERSFRLFINPKEQ